MLVITDQYPASCTRAVDASLAWQKIAVKHPYQPLRTQKNGERTRRSPVTRPSHLREALASLPHRHPLQRGVPYADRAIRSRELDAWRNYAPRISHRAEKLRSAHIPPCERLPLTPDARTCNASRINACARAAHVFTIIGRFIFSPSRTAKSDAGGKYPPFLGEFSTPCATQKNKKG